MVSKFNKDKSAKALLLKAYKIVSSVSKSGKATEALIQAAGEKLVSLSVTHWTSVYLVVKRLLEVKESLMHILVANNMNTLQPEEWDTLVDVQDPLHKPNKYCWRRKVPYPIISNCLLQRIRMSPATDDGKTFRGSSCKDYVRGASYSFSKNI